MNKNMVAGIVGLGLLVGGLGGCSAEPEVIIEEKIVEVVVEKDVVVNVPTVPQVCAEALATGEEVNGLLVDREEVYISIISELVPEILHAVAADDGVEMDRLHGELEDKFAELHSIVVTDPTNDYNDLAAKCFDIYEN